MKLTILKTSGHSFSGTVEIYGLEFTIEGDFFVEWDDDTPMPMVEDCFICFNCGMVLEIKDDYLLTELGIQLEDFENANWYEDHQADLSCQAFDRYKDSYKYGE